MSYYEPTIAQEKYFSNNELDLQMVKDAVISTALSNAISIDSDSLLVFWNVTGYCVAFDVSKDNIHFPVSALHYIKHNYSTKL